MNDEQQKQLLAIVRNVAAMQATTGNGHCDACGGTRVRTYDAKRHTQHLSDDYEHEADCPIAEARAFLASAGQAESKGE